MVVVVNLNVQAAIELPSTPGTAPVFISASYLIPLAGMLLGVMVSVLLLMVVLMGIYFSLLFY
jgi:hypothetical protein